MDGGQRSWWLLRLRPLSEDNSVQSGPSSLLYSSSPQSYLASTAFDTESERNCDAVLPLDSVEKRTHTGGKVREECPRLMQLSSPEDQEWCMQFTTKGDLSEKSGCGAHAWYSNDACALQKSLGRNQEFNIIMQRIALLYSIRWKCNLMEVWSVICVPSNNSIRRLHSYEENTE